MSQLPWYLWVSWSLLAMALVVFFWRTYGQVVGLRQLPESPDGPVVAFERVRSTGLRRLLLANALVLAAASIAIFAEAGTTVGAIFTAVLVPMAIGGAYLQNWFWARPYRGLSNKGIERTAKGSINQ